MANKGTLGGCLSNGWALKGKQTRSAVGRPTGRPDPQPLTANPEVSGIFGNARFLVDSECSWKSCSNRTVLLDLAFG